MSICNKRQYPWNFYLSISTTQVPYILWIISWNMAWRLCTLCQHLHRLGSTGRLYCGQRMIAFLNLAQKVHRWFGNHVVSSFDILDHDYTILIPLYHCDTILYHLYIVISVYTIVIPLYIILFHCYTIVMKFQTIVTPLFYYIVILLLCHCYTIVKGLRSAGTVEQITHGWKHSCQVMILYGVYINFIIQIFSVQCFYFQCMVAPTDKNVNENFSCVQTYCNLCVIKRVVGFILEYLKL